MLFKLLKNIGLKEKKPSAAAGFLYENKKAYKKRHQVFSLHGECNY